MNVEKPIFIIGFGRSGSTIFYRMFSNHPQVAWLSLLLDRFPKKPVLNRMLFDIIEAPLIGNHVKKYIKANECYEFWDHYCRGFSVPFRDLLPEDVTVRSKKRVQGVMSELLTSRRNRLVAKITGWPRIGFIKEIFNDAKFINVTRDGRASVNSWLSKDSWWGWRGPQNWRYGELSQAHQEEWDKHNRSFVALAGIQWKIFIDAMEKSNQFLNKDNYLEVRYEDLCSNALSTFKEVAEFCELPWNSTFEKSINSYSLRNTNDKWKKELTTKQQNILQDVLHEYLERYNYPL